MSFEEGRSSFTAEPSHRPSLPDGENTSTRPAITTDGSNQTMDNQTMESRERLEHVLHSDIGISTLLNRLKQSTSSVRDFATFLKEMATLEEKHAQGLKRVSRSTMEMIRRPESRQGSFAQNYEEITRVHDRMGDQGAQFANTLYMMSDELQDLATNSEKGRKHWKQTGLFAEKRVQDAEKDLDKAKHKYMTLADQYDRARTGERQGGKFGLKKSAAQQEEDLQRKVEMADSDYAAKVQSAQSQRRELVSTHRPQAVNALQELIRECDSGLSMQIQKYAMLSEKLVLGNGLCISPLKNQQSGSGLKGLREVAQGIDNHKDFHEYITGFSNKAGSVTPEIKYEKHPAFSPKAQQQPFPTSNSSFSQPPNQYTQHERTNSGFSQEPSQPGQISGVIPTQSGPTNGLPHSPGHAPFQSADHSRGPSYGNTKAPQLPQIESLSTGDDFGRSQPSEYAPPPGEPWGRPSSAHDRRDQPTVPDKSIRSVSSPMSSSDQSNGRFQQAPRPGYGPPTRPEDTNVAPSTRMPGGFNDSYQSNNGGPPIGPAGRGRGLPPNPNSGPSFGPQNDYGPTGRGALQSHLPDRSAPPSGHSNGRGMPSNGPMNGKGIAMGSGGLATAASAIAGSKGPENDTYGAQKGYQGPQSGINTSTPPNAPTSQKRTDGPRQNLPPLKPVFGVPLEELFRRDNSAVPTIVYQCIQAVDLFGLNTEGIYRTSGSAPYIMEMKALFDHDASQIDFRNPASFHHDIASVTTLLKHFLRDLPDPLLTGREYPAFIEAAKLDDVVVRRDSLHAIINNLPDANYATLRVIALHLSRVAQHSDKNRMTPSNLAICFGPTLMGQQNGGQASDIRDAGWQARVIETILNNTFQIFDDDE